MTTSNVPRQARRSLLQIGEKLRNEMAERAPQKTTDLARSIIVDETDDLVVAVGPSVDYGLYVVEGTGKFGPKKAPYVIRPRRKRALKFHVGGAWVGPGRDRSGRYAKAHAAGGNDVIVRSVLHPGIRPNPFPDEAWEAIADWAGEKLANDLGAAVVKDLGFVARKTW